MLKIPQTMSYHAKQDLEAAKVLHCNTFAALCRNVKVLTNSLVNDMSIDIIVIIR